MAKSKGLGSFGAKLDAIMGENDVRLGIEHYLDTGVPELNFALSGSYRDGGIAGGRIIEIFGPSSSGKTFLSTMVMMAAQKMGGVAVFADHERSFEPALAESLGLSLSSDNFRYIRPKTFEESVNTAMNVAEKSRESGDIPREIPIVWVFDSLASMVPAEKLYNDKGERRDPKEINMKLKLALATATSQNFPTLSMFAEDYNVTIVFLNQLRKNPAVMYGKDTVTPGGEAPAFYASTRVALKKKEITNGKRGDDKEILGFEVTAICEKSKVTRPFRKAKWQVRFNEDGKAGVFIDKVASTVDLLKRLGLIEMSGTRVEWEGKKMFESQLVKMLKEDPEGINKLLDRLPGGEDHTSGDAVKEIPEDE